MNIIKMLLVAVVLACGDWVGASPSSASPSGPSTNPAAGSAPDQVQRALGIKGAGADVLAPLAEVLAVFVRDPGAAQQSIDALVAALTQGADVKAVSSAYVANSNVDSFYNPDKPGAKGVGTFQERLQLAGYLWEKAVGYANASPDRAADYARAALLLGALEDSPVSNSMLEKFAASDEFARIGRLSPDQRRQLRLVVDEQKQSTKQSLETYTQASRRIWGLVEKKGPIPDEELRTIFDRMDQFRTTVRQPAQLHQGVHALWRLRNLASERKDESGIKKIDAYLNAWQASAKGTVVARWLQEAETTKGPPPRLLR